MLEDLEGRGHVNRCNVDLEFLEPNHYLPHLLSPLTSHFALSDLDARFVVQSALSRRSTYHYAASLSSSYHMFEIGQ